MLNTQYTTPKRKNGIFSIKKRRATKVALLLMLLCYCFSTITLATETNVTLRQITTFEMYGYDSSLTTQAWRSVTYSITGSNSLKTAFIGYGQSRQRILFSIGNSSINIRQFRIEFDIKAKNIHATGESSPACRIPQTSSTWNYGQYYLVNEEEVGNDIIRTYHIFIQKDGININSSTLSIYTYFSIVSTEYSIENFSCVLNDTIMLSLNEYTVSYNQMEQAKQALYDAIDQDGMNQLPNRLLSVKDRYNAIANGITQYQNIINQTYYDSILNTSTIIVQMISMTMLITICSYILFGKLR